MYGNENSAEGGFEVERTILLLGNPELYEASQEVKIEELHQMEQVREDLKDTLLAFRARYGVGRDWREKACYIQASGHAGAVYQSPACLSRTGNDRRAG